MESGIHQWIHANSRTMTDPAGRQAQIIEDHSALEMARQCGLGLYEVYQEALKLGVYPCRYIRNLNIISAAEQLTLAQSQVAVIGAGGLGGHVIILLARIGVGRLIVADADRFDETNLNRQILCNQDTLGRSKSRTAADAVASVNPGVKVEPHMLRISDANIDAILAGADVVVDALDNVPDRQMLQEASRRLGIPLVHGAIAGFEGRILSIYPGDTGMRTLYGIEETRPPDTDRPEALLGVPAVTASLIGTFQAMEVIKILLHRGKIWRNIMAYIDLENGSFDEFRLDGSANGVK